MSFEKTTYGSLSRGQRARFGCNDCDRRGRHTHVRTVTDVRPYETREGPHVNLSLNRRLPGGPLTIYPAEEEVEAEVPNPNISQEQFRE